MRAYSLLGIFGILFFVYQMIFAIPDRFTICCAYTSSIVFLLCCMYQTWMIWGQCKPKKDKFDKDWMSRQTWACSVCKKKRLDHFIAVVSYEFDFFTRNVRYCIDNTECMYRAFNRALWSPLNE